MSIPEVSMSPVLELRRGSPIPILQTDRAELRRARLRSLQDAVADNSGVGVQQLYYAVLECMNLEFETD